MDINGKRVLVCDCNGTMPIDGRALGRACAGAGGSAGALEIHTLLCRTQLAKFEAALRGEQAVIVACTQEAPLFAEARAEAGVDTDIRFVNIREHAGWSIEGSRAIPKMAALLADAAVDSPPAETVTLKSAGVTLIYGRDETAIAAARQIADRLDCTVLLTQPGDIAPPRLADIPIFRGTIISAKGHMGAFDVTVNDYGPMIPSSRGALRFAAPQDGAFSSCDLILDLSGGAPLFPAHDRRDGYFRADPRDAAALQKALFDLVEMVGEFEKPIYVAYDATICVHGRNGLRGCSACVDVCPTGAIVPSGDRVVIDAFSCAGCGGCASVCPTGAASYAVPARNLLLERLRIVLSTYRDAGGETPVLLVHDGEHGEEMISALARHGRGLPAYVIPFRVNSVPQVGLDFFATALAYGAAAVRLLIDPLRRDETAGLGPQIELANTALRGLGYGEARVKTIEDTDPDVVEAGLYELRPQPSPQPGRFAPAGGKRRVALQALRHLQEAAPARVDILPLTPGAPFGAINVDVDGCTLCLACISACPTGALLDASGRKSLALVEQSCIQCGLCISACPEDVIALEPRLNFAATGSPVVLKDDPGSADRATPTPILVWAGDQTAAAAKFHL